ncbi:MAG: polyphenol oxidase family protein, partial [Oscillospiraceae bacterium]|nr:polyphenol oxidase family protein [Oscillospiraceae bacterium]
VGEAVPYAADGLVTARSGLALMVFIADCVPVLLEDAQAGVIAAVHCGWRSSVGDILGVAVRKMCALGAEPSRICAAIGESIGACCFETDADVPEAVENYLSGDTAGLIFPQPDGKFKVDLRGANRRRLLSLGLRPENIDVSDECTMCSRQKYWSHRATNGVRGTQAATIILP